MSSRRRIIIPRQLPWLMILGLACYFAAAGLAAQAARAGERSRIEITSTLDGTRQPSYLILPAGFDPQGARRPLLVSVHSWSADLEQRRPQLEAAAEARGWIYLAPNFRGPNQHPDACGSLQAQQDILDAVAWAKEHLPVDERRVYLTGASGGGHMTLLMVGRHPRLWAAASAWVGISDLRAWHAKHADDRYGMMIRASCGGAPGSSPAVDAEYRARSPLTWLHQAAGVPLDIAAGIHDGHTGSVPIHHSLDAFNVIARAAGQPVISPEEIRQLSQPQGRLRQPQASDQERDEALGRAIYLRRYAGPARVTIFEGGHEAIDAAAIDWLQRHPRERP